jgi:hypothetical protein
MSFSCRLPDCHRPTALQAVLCRPHWRTLPPWLRLRITTRIQVSTVDPRLLRNVGVRSPVNERRWIALVDLAIALCFQAQGKHQRALPFLARVQTMDPDVFARAATPGSRSTSSARGNAGRRARGD